MRAAIDSRLQQRRKEKVFCQRITHILPVEAVAYYLGLQSHFDQPQLVICANTSEAENFVESLAFWNPHKSVVELPYYSPHMYSGVNLSRRQLHQRLQWLFKALNSYNDCIFLAPMGGLLQRTLPTDLFFDNLMELKVGDEIPQDFFVQLHQAGYAATPLVEDKGTFAQRGGIIDVFSSQMLNPVRIELSGEEIESMRIFDASTQRTLAEVKQIAIAPAREVLLSNAASVRAAQTLLQYQDPELHSMAHHLRRNEYCDNLEFYLPLFYQKLTRPIDYFQSPPLVWLVNEMHIETSAQSHLAELTAQYKEARHPVKVEDLHDSYLATKELFKQSVAINKLEILESPQANNENILQLTGRRILPPPEKKFAQQITYFCQALLEQLKTNNVLVAVRGEQQLLRVKSYLAEENIPFEYLDSTRVDWEKIFDDGSGFRVYFIERRMRQSFHISSEEFSVISFEQFFGRTYARAAKQSAGQRGKHLSFGEINENDFVIHAVHGVCQFAGLTKMMVGGVENEFLTLLFKDKDKLFLPIYRIHQIYKYASERITPSLDKLGGTNFENVKTKTKKRLRELAGDLIDLYAKRQQTLREPYRVATPDISDFYHAFPYEETEDQLKAIEDLSGDLLKNKPLDRLICGDVGFGKTEVAMRAAFVVASQGHQVTVLAPTTVLTMQHAQTFAKRFQGWPLRIEVVNRLQSAAQVKSTLAATKNGEVDILIGTHRLLSKDVEFKNLGLLVIDEEQKFGVAHKEKIRKMKVNVDTIALSATPIPRTLNLSLLGIRDLSLINTAPVDRLETRTFVCKYNEEIIHRAVMTEISRGGQVFFLHNRVQSIHSVANDLRRILPKVRIGIAHGQLKEQELEAAMVSFFAGEMDVLLCTTIIESGVDIPNANTILINHAENFGLSQLYQLRGRVGRSGRRAYCYLLTDNHKKLTEIAKERLKIIQEHTALGSGMQIAQYDMELRGAGTLLGEEQSGLIDSVGYEFYLELLDEAIKEARGENVTNNVEPEITLRIRAFIPHTYIGNIRLRLAYYRAMTTITNESDIDDLEAELKDQFGKLPEEVTNLLGIMLIRHICMRLGVRDLAAGKDGIILAFTEQTPFPPAKAIELASQSNKKYSLAPDNRLKIRLKDISWPKVYDEVSFLMKYCK